VSHSVYLVIHIVGILLLFSGLTALVGASLKGAPAKGTRFGLALIHGFGMLLVLISGFGMLARLGFMANIPGWAYGKIAIWILLGASMILAKRKAEWGLSLILFWVVLGGLAACLAVFKPF
jgi:hypothetical protein